MQHSTVIDALTYILNETAYPHTHFNLRDSTNATENEDIIALVKRQNKGWDEFDGPGWTDMAMIVESEHEYLLGYILKYVDNHDHGISVAFSGGLKMLEGRLESSQNDGVH